ncbi:MAG: phage portal protein [Melioribacteraceae bacterium]
MATPFDLEIKARRSSNASTRKTSLPWLNQYQYGRELYSDDNFYAMINAYKSWVYVAASKNATTCASTPLRLYVAKNNKGSLKGYPTRKVTKQAERYLRENSSLENIPAFRKAVEIEEVLQHPFLDLKTNVNPFLNSFDLMEMTQLNQELTGNAYWQIITDRMGVPKEIWIIPTTDCKIIPHPTKFISGYKYIKGSTEIDLSEKEVIHFKMPNPKSQYYGFAPFSSVGDIYNLDRSINEYEESIFRNGGTLSGIFETEEALGDHEYQRLKEEIKENFTGKANVGKMPLLDNGLKYKQLGTSPKEMSHLGGREYVKESILNAFGISLGMFSKDSNRANVQGAIKQYTEFTIKPRLIRFQEKLNEKLIPMYDEKLFVAFNSPVPEDEEFALNQRVKHVNFGIETINEVRRELGKEPFDSRFDEPIIPVNMTHIDNILASIANGTGEGNIVDSPGKMLKLLNR